MLTNVWKTRRAPTPIDAPGESKNPRAPVAIKQKNMTTSPSMYSVARPKRTMRNHEAMPPVKYWLRAGLYEQQAPARGAPADSPISDQVQIKGGGLGESRTLKKHDSKPQNGITAQDLRGPDDAVDLGTPEIGAAEALEIARPGRFRLFELAGVNNVGQLIVDACLGDAVALPQSDKGLARLVELAAANRVPGGLWRKIAAYQKGNRPYPLKNEGKAPAWPRRASQYGSRVQRPRYTHRDPRSDSS